MPKNIKEVKKEESLKEEKIITLTQEELKQLTIPALLTIEVIAVLDNLIEKLAEEMKKVDNIYEGIFEQINKDVDKEEE